MNIKVLIILVYCNLDPIFAGLAIISIGDLGITL